jgi:hypothetical protein
MILICRANFTHLSRCPHPPPERLSESAAPSRQGVAAIGITPQVRKRRNRRRLASQPTQNSWQSKPAFNRRTGILLLRAFLPNHHLTIKRELQTGHARACLYPAVLQCHGSPGHAASYGVHLRPRRQHSWLEAADSNLAITNHQGQLGEIER